MAAILLLPLAIGVWSPDLLSGRSHTIAQQRLRDGSEFRVVQYWNRVDFYSTELHHVFPDGHDQTWVVDGDDRKRWRIGMTVDENARTVLISDRGGTSRTVKW
jgi:hypothetical protein